jgi:hypothetical protein
MSVLAEKEDLAVSITLSGTYWRDAPKYEIYIDDDLITSGQIPMSSSRRGLPDETMTVTERISSLFQVDFNVSLASGEHVLKIRFPEKSKKDTLLNKDGTVSKDLLLTVENITIDGVDLGSLLYKESRYDFDQEQLHHGEMRDHTTNCTTMGYVGTWSIPITSPFYLWLLERL